MAGRDPSGAVAVLTHGGARHDTGGANAWMTVFLRGIANWIAYSTGDYATARSEAQLALAAARRIGAPTVLAATLVNHAIAISEDNPDETLAAADESVQLTEAGAGDTAYSAAPSIGAMPRAAHGYHAAAARATRIAVAHAARTGHRAYLGLDVTVAALVLSGRADTFEAAATLAGAVAGPVFGFSTAWLNPQWQNRYQQRLAEAAAALGDQHYDDARQRGATMTYDQIIAYTLEQLDRV